MGYHGISYVKKIPVMCRLHGSKDISLCQHMTTLELNKVGAGTFGHPVDINDGYHVIPRKKENEMFCYIGILDLLNHDNYYSKVHKYFSIIQFYGFD